MERAQVAERVTGQLKEHRGSLGFVRYSWHEAKAESNRRRHGVSFEEASEVFADPLLRMAADPHHSRDENRFFAIGETSAGVLLAVSYAIDDEGDVRLISARHATRLEMRRYMNIHELRDGEEQEDYGDIDTRHIDWTKAKVGPPFKIDRGPATITLDEHVRLFFFGDVEVNNALRALIHEGRIGLHFVGAGTLTKEAGTKNQKAGEKIEENAKKAHQ